MKGLPVNQNMRYVPGIGRLDELPREFLGHLPTPIEDMSRLSSHLSAGNLYVKRDDCTGPDLVLNKVR